MFTPPRLLSLRSSSRPSPSRAGLSHVTHFWPSDEQIESKIGLRRKFRIQTAVPAHEWNRKDRHAIALPWRGRVASSKRRQSHCDCSGAPKMHCCASKPGRTSNSDHYKLSAVRSAGRSRMPKPKRQMKLGVSMIGLGYHIAAWRHPDVPADGSTNTRHSVEVAQTAERGKLDMVFLADAVGIREYDEPPGALCRFSNSSSFESITVLASLSMVTQRMGLVATLSTTYSEPFHVARQFASIDHLSGGRAGWNVVTSVTPMEAQNFNYETTPDYDKRYGRAAEFVEVVRGLWDCWEDDAFVRDKASGIFFDPAKLHVLDHKGPHFSVRGPINIPRTPQGYPVIVQAGASEQGQDMAAATADVVFEAHASIENAQKYYASVKGRMAKFGRPTN